MGTREAHIGRALASALTETQRQAVSFAGNSKLAIGWMSMQLRGAWLAIPKNARTIDPTRPLEGGGDDEA